MYFMKEFLKTVLCRLHYEGALDFSSFYIILHNCLLSLKLHMN